MADGLRLELRQEVIDRTIAFIDHFKQLASRGLLFRAEAKPIEAVIPNLTNLVEQTCLALFFRGFDRLRHARALEARSDERREGKSCVRKCRTRWSAVNEKRTHSNVKNTILYNKLTTINIK